MVRPGFTPEEQAGFRHGYSTSDNISSLQSIVQKYITKKRGKIYRVFIYFSKAFHSIDCKILFYCLINKGVNNKMITILQSIY